jgi:8-oxo-dGTP diphosphatase
VSSAALAAARRDFHLVAWLILQRADGAVLLARRAGVGYGDGLWGLPGGHVEEDEQLGDAAIRELREEVGVEVARGGLMPIGVTRYAEGDVWGADFFFLAHAWTGQPEALSQCSEIAWCSPHALPEGSLPWLARALRSHLIDGQWFDESV